ncbi:cellulose binding domain-containing protein [Actinospica sp. MGRD01-02]|uniref:Cellulose binding domain-containing protein n=1 Tax=Actinospica acidithermotolerans TaxID=2828514 RepID=A0A941EA32_9ACTN|nr:cellulose binding domain-containing protein [Actinospica acidithermotolerans]MBR7826698.1 cellulose binding domain-containing protein [Actinospica acidithermotolerans]
MRSRTHASVRGRHATAVSIRTLIAVLCAVGLAAMAVIAGSAPADALDVTGSGSPVTGNATYFSGLGSPYGGCGLPQADLDTQDFLALNVYNTPGNYGSEPRPIPAADASMTGMFDNGLNCGRYVQVTIGDYCTGTNDGAQNESFCRNGSWVADQYNGATLTFVVADSCADANAWCRDDPYHVDLAQNSLSQFLLNGATTAGLPGKWNNRQVSWQFVSAPNYSGDINIGFIQGAQAWWSAIAISHLPNGIHGVRYYANGTWQSGTMDSDMGDDYIIAPTTSGGSQYEIQVIDASDSLLNNGEVYSFSMPSSCGTQCSAAYTATTYTTSTGPTASASQSTSASASASTSTSGTSSSSAGPTATGATGGTTGASAGAQCAATVSTVSSWTGGYQVSINVANTGTAATTTWKTVLALPGSDTIASSWNATTAQSGQTVTAVAASYDGAVAAGASTSWGMTVNGSGPPPTSATCSAG